MIIEVTCKDQTIALDAHEVIMIEKYRSGEGRRVLLVQLTHNAHTLLDFCFDDVEQDAAYQYIKEAMKCRA